MYSTSKSMIVPPGAVRKNTAVDPVNCHIAEVEPGGGTHRRYAGWALELLVAVFSAFGEFVKPNHTSDTETGAVEVDETGAQQLTDLMRNARANCATVVFTTVHTVPSAPKIVAPVQDDNDRAEEAAKRNLCLRIMLVANEGGPSDLDRASDWFELILLFTLFIT